MQKVGEKILGISVRGDAPARWQKKINDCRSQLIK